MKNALKSGILFLVLPLFITACGDGSKSGAKTDSLATKSSNTVTDTLKKDTTVAGAANKTDTIVTKQSTKTEVKKQ